MDDATLTTMRADWRKVQRHAEIFGWSPDDVREIGDEIAEAVQSGEAERIDGWAADLRDRAGEVEAITESCRAMEQRIRQQAEARRQAEEGAK